MKKRTYQLLSIFVLGISACQTNPSGVKPQASPSPVQNSPQPNSSTSVKPSGNPSLPPVATPSPGLSPLPSSLPSTLPSATVVPSPGSLPSPSTTPTGITPLEFQRIKVLAGADPEDGELKSGINADDITFPTLVTELVLDPEGNTWFFNASNRILAYITSEIIRPSSQGDLKYRLYWEKLKDLQGRGGMLFDKRDGQFYLVQTTLNRVVKLNPETGEVTPAAGSGQQGFNGDGAALEVRLDQPTDIAQDSLGNFYITDTGNHLIRKLTADGKVITIAGQYIEDSIIFDHDGDGDIEDEDEPSFLPIGDTTGDGGPARNARVDTPQYIAAEKDGTVYFTSASDTIRRIKNDIIEKYAGSGNSGYNGPEIRADLAHLSNTQRLIFGPDQLLYFVDNLRIRRVQPDQTGTLIVKDIVGNGKTSKLVDSLTEPLSAELEPGPFDFDSDGNLYVYDITHRRIRMLEIENEDS